MKEDDYLNKILMDSMSKPLNVSEGDLSEYVLLRLITNSYLTTTVLRRQIELEQIVKNGTSDPDKASDELKELCEVIADKATAAKNSILADLHLRNNPDQNR